MLLILVGLSLVFVTLITWVAWNLHQLIGMMIKQFGHQLEIDKELLTRVEKLEQKERV